jgi:hypothetical protein
LVRDARRCGLERGREALAATADDRAEVRAVACKLLDGIGYVGNCEFGLGGVAGAMAGEP